MEKTKCRALRAFTEHVPGVGMVHGDPDNSDERARFPLIPDTVIARLIEEEKVEPLDAVGGVIVDAPLAGTGEAIQIDGALDADGNSIPPVATDFAMTHLGFGKYEITGPGVPVDTVIQGKNDAQTYVDDMRAAQAKVLQPVKYPANLVLISVDEGGTFTVHAPWLEAPATFDTAEAAEARQAELREAGPPEGWVDPEAGEHEDAPAS